MADDKKDEESRAERAERAREALRKQAEDIRAAGERIRGLGGPMPSAPPSRDLSWQKHVYSQPEEPPGRSAVPRPGKPSFDPPRPLDIAEPKKPPDSSDVAGETTVSPSNTAVMENYKRVFAEPASSRSVPRPNDGNRTAVDATKENLMANAFRNWTIFGVVRWSITILAVAVIVFVAGVWAESNVRHFFEDRGWDTVLTRILATMPAYLSYYPTWLGIGLIFGAAAMIWLIWAFPHRLGDHQQLPKSRGIQWMTAIAAAIVISGAFYLAVNQSAPAVAPSTTVYAPPTEEQVSKAAEPLVKAAEIKTQSLVDAANKERDSERQANNETYKQFKAISPFAKEAIATRAELWKSVQEGPFSELSNAYSAIKASMQQWPQKLQSRGDYLNRLLAAQSALSKALKNYDDIRFRFSSSESLNMGVFFSKHEYMNELTAALDDFIQAIRNSPDDEKLLTARAGAVDQAAIRADNWIGNLKSLIDSNRKNLSDLEMQLP